MSAVDDVQGDDSETSLPPQEKQGVVSETSLHPTCIPIPYLLMGKPALVGETSLQCGGIQKPDGETSLSGTPTGIVAPQEPFDARSPSHARHVVEYCCSHDFLLGMPSPHTVDCRVVRLTIDDDVTSVHGHTKAMHAVQLPRCLLWASMPCTGGCPWQRINIHIPGVAVKIRKHIALFKKIWSSFVFVASRALECGGHIAIEWPASCAYWGWDDVREFIDRHGLSVVRFDGCAFGVRSPRTGLPIR
jgi:hypothetical protein